MSLASYPLLEDFLMKRVIIVSFNATTPVAADMYRYVNNLIITIGEK